MGRETKEIRRIYNEEGTLTDEFGLTARVRFSLVQIQDFINDIPTQTGANGNGSLEFENAHDAWNMTNSPEKKKLKGGGIEADVLVVSEDSFCVTGPIKDA
jgi:hypothetical protein